MTGSADSATVGVLMLDTQFPRIHGDIGNERTWDFPVLFKRVKGAPPDQVVYGQGVGTLPLFIEAANQLVREGADGITTGCGFLALFQDEIASAVSVPVATSSLMQVPIVARMIPSDRRVGIVTISAKSLTPAHLAKVGVPADTPIGTTEGKREFTRAILEDEPNLDVEASRLDNLEAAQELIAQYPDLGALVLECTNMTPYAKDIRQATGLPVFTVESLIRWFQRGLAPAAYDMKLEGAVNTSDKTALVKRH